MVLVTSHRNRKLQAPSRFQFRGPVSHRGGPPGGTPALPQNPLSAAPVRSAGRSATSALQGALETAVNKALGTAFGDLGTQLSRLIPAGQVALGAVVALVGALLVVSQTTAGRTVTRTGRRVAGTAIRAAPAGRVIPRGRSLR